MVRIENEEKTTAETVNETEGLTLPSPPEQEQTTEQEQEERNTEYTYRSRVDVDFKDYSSDALLYDSTNLKGVMNAFMSEIIHWTWSDMLELKNNPKTAIIYNTVISLVRVCAEGKIPALRMFFDRIDGRVEQPINIIRPKIYLRYPNATNGEELQNYLDLHGNQDPTAKKAKKSQQRSKKKLDIESLGLSDTLRAMMKAPIDLPAKIIETRMLVDKAVERGEIPQYSPYVKVVLCAALIKNANLESNYEALQMLFERIEGKIEETIKVIGEDMFIDQYDDIAPKGSVLIDGQWCFEDGNITNQWVEGFISTKKNLELENNDGTSSPN